MRLRDEVKCFNIFLTVLAGVKLHLCIVVKPQRREKFF